MCDSTLNAVQPRFTHDCDRCHFLGYYTDEGRLMDLYVCKGILTTTVIARFGNEGPEYSSGMCFAYGRIPALAEARHRAQAVGLLDYDVQEALSYTIPGTPEQKELEKALPFTLEYQVYLAYRAGDLDRSQGLATHLLQRLMTRSYYKEQGEGTALLDIESNISKIVGILTKRQAFEIRTDTAEALDFLWKRLEARDTSTYRVAA